LALLYNQGAHSNEFWLRAATRASFSVIRLAFSGCHENVTQFAENSGKTEANESKGRRKQVAGICPNLLNSLD
jgi:hypothetical protein